MRMSAIAAVLCVALAGCPGPEAAESEQCPAESCPAALSNGSFETGRSYDANQAEGWFGSDPTVFVHRVNSGADGDWAMELRLPVNYPRVEVLELQTSSGIWAAPGATYAVGFSADVPEGSLTLSVKWMDDLNQCVTDATGACRVDTLQYIRGASGYSKAAAELAAPRMPSPRRLYASLHFRAEVPPGGTALIDAVTFAAQ